MKNFSIYNSENKLLCTLNLKQFDFLCRSMGFTLLHPDDFEAFINSGKVKCFLMKELGDYQDKAINMGLYNEQDILETISCLQDITEESAKELYTAVCKAMDLINMVCPSGGINNQVSSNHKQLSIRRLYMERNNVIRSRLLLSIMSK